VAGESLRTALILPVPEAAAAVDAWRERTCEAKPSTGVPAHVTLIFPFVPASEVDDDLIAEVGALIGTATSFRFALQETDRFAAVLFLAPHPAEPFIRLTDAITERYPRYLPYGGAFGSSVPHLTVAQGNDGLLDQAEASVSRLLPIAAEAREALLLEEVVADWGRWEIRAHLPLRDGYR
jgi:2'-5' RNA ligase